MSKITYYPTIFHTNPFAYNMTELWEQKSSLAKELILKNSKAKELGITQMQLNVSKFSVVDKNGKEFVQQNFPRTVEFTSKGIETQFYVRKESILQLEKGAYTTIRFYLEDTGNTVVYNNRRKEVVSHLQYIDFDLRNDLILDENKELLVAMRFDFVPFTLASYFKPLLNLFKRTKPLTGKLASSLGN